MTRTRSRFLRAAVPALLLLGLAPRALAQQATGVLTGYVTDTAGARVPYALVSIGPAGSERFTDERGGFLAAGLGTGAHRVRVRQVGFTPFDSAVVVTPATPPLHVVLRPLAVHLEALTVSAPAACRNPGPPDAASAPELATVFAELSENARRFAVLADSYPFVFFLERRFTELDRRGRVLWTDSDTVEHRSNARVSYRPGGVIGWGVDVTGTQDRTIRLPSLPDLADTIVHATHCFAYGGERELDGTRLLRISFRADDHLATADVDGDAYLDPVTFQLREVTIQLNALGLRTLHLRSSSVTMTLRELFPDILVPGTVRASLVPQQTVHTRTGRPVVEDREVQRLLRTDFQRALPSDSTRQP